MRLRTVAGLRRAWSTMEEWSVSSSPAAKKAINPIRQCTETHFVGPVSRSQKDLYRLGIGDPSVFGNLPPHPAALSAVQNVLETGNSYSYGMSYGYEKARAAIAQRFSSRDRPLTADDVVMATGCAGALEMSINVLCEPGTNVLVPSPCYSLYKCIAGVLGLELKYYKLRPENAWEADLAQLESLIDSRTRAIVVINPSNPCGSVYSLEHLRSIAAVAHKHRVTIVSDEVYADVVYSGQTFHPVSSACGDLPVLTCGSLSKRYLVPGWRVGWVILHDKLGLFNKEVRPGLRQLATRNVGPCALVQAAIPQIFETVPDSFYKETIAVYEGNARACYDKLCGVEGLRPSMPVGAMYMMVEIELDKFPEFEDDISFLKQLIVEQGVMCLPGSAFEFPSAMRIALIMPTDKLSIACERIREFCAQHIK